MSRARVMANLASGLTSSFAELNYNDITTIVIFEDGDTIQLEAEAGNIFHELSGELGTSQASKVVTADASGHVIFADGTSNVDIASHDGTNGLKLGGTLVTTTATDLNNSATTGKSIAMAIVFGG
jgi:hypothetical protein